MEPSLNLPAVLVATVCTFAVGGLWYSPLLFGKRWMAYNGLSEKEIATGTARVFGGAFVLSLLMIVNLAMFIGPEASMGFAVFAAVAAGFGWISLGMGVTYLFERKPLGLWLINAGYHAVSFTVAGVVLGAWP